MCDDPESLRRMRYKRQVGVSRVAAAGDSLGREPQECVMNQNREP